MRPVYLVALCLILAACSPSPTTVPLTTTDCFWNWNTRPLPKLSERVQAALDAAGIADASASAVAFGEDCIDPQTNTVRRFATMETDFYINLHVDNLADFDALGNLAAQVLAVLDSFPPDGTPGPQPGRIELTFVAGEEERNLWFTVGQAADVRNQGLSGAALLEALGY